MIIRVFLALTFSLHAHFALAITAPRTDTVCDEAARLASAHMDVPLTVLMAVARVETGRKTKSGIRPWPWALNIDGEGYWFLSSREAWQVFKRQLANGQNNVDVGCFQVNYRWHGMRFASPLDMLDPQTNANYAAGLLRKLYVEKGTWDGAVAAYHSRTPKHAAKYLKRFRSAYANLTEASRTNRRQVLYDVTNFGSTPNLSNNASPNGGSLFPSASQSHVPFISLLSSSQP